MEKDFDDFTYSSVTGLLTGVVIAASNTRSSGAEDHTTRLLDFLAEEVFEALLKEQRLSDRDRKDLARLRGLVREAAYGRQIHLYLSPDSPRH